MVLQEKSDNDQDTDNGQTGTRRPPKQSRFRIAVSLWAERRLPLLLFVIAVGLAGFTAGASVVEFDMAPYATISFAYRTALSLYTFIDEKRGSRPLEDWKDFVDVAPDGVEAHRIKSLTAAGLTDPILVWGGLKQFAEYCPGHAGCLAVEFAGSGEVRHAYPYRPEEIEKAAIVSFPYEQPPWFSFQDHATVEGIARYSNGDLLVVFYFYHSFPHSGGVARIARDGQPVWYRQDYSHHVPHITDDDVALVPGRQTVEGPILADLLKEQGIEWRCPASRQRSSLLHEVVRVIDGDGRILKEFSILDAILKPPYLFLMKYALEVTHPCDPLHLNSVHRLGEDAIGPNGIGPGDIVVSLRNLNAFGILDRDGHRLKKLVRGRFLQQHHVTHLAGSTFLMFDNKGTDGVHGPSQLLMVDVVNGTATTIFPNDATPERLRLVSGNRGTAFVSPDRLRAIVAITTRGKAVEVRLADGAVLTEFTSLHDVSRFDSFPEERHRQAYLHTLAGIIYVDRERE